MIFSGYILNSGMLDYMLVVLFVVFKGTSLLFSIVGPVPNGLFFL